MREESDSAFDHLDTEIISRYLACEAESENKLPSSNIPNVWNALSKELVLSHPAKSTHQKHPEGGVSKSVFSDQIFRFDAKKYGVLSGLKVPRWVGYSALAVGLSFMSWQVFQSHLDNQRSIPEIKTYTTLPGQRASLNLSDGSRVTLGPATTLRITYPNASTAIEVNGEALFNVNHAAKRPFIVTAHGVTARVLGTEFVVRAYDASHIRVAVREGRVSVKSPVFTAANAAVVAAGEAASVAPNALPLVAPISDLPTDFAWADGELVLRNIPLGEALVRLSRWYGMDFQVADSAFLNSRITSTFQTAFSESRIKVMARVIGARVTRSGNTVTFSAPE